MAKKKGFDWVVPIALVGAAVLAPQYMLPIAAVGGLLQGNMVMLQ
jgi:hypothetical protein